ncbi:thioredoxin family protein [bacterium]|nr:thioredoxin family protein [bacterium]
MKLKVLFLLTALLVSAAIGIGCQNESGNKSGIEWQADMEKALALAGANHKPLMIDFTATWCPPCQMMEDSTFQDIRVIEKAQSFVAVRIDVDEQGEIANKYHANAGKYGGIGIPNVLFLDAHGDELRHPIGFQGPEIFLAIMDSVLHDAEHHHH